MKVARVGNLVSTIGYAARVVRVLSRHPVEGLDRMRGRLEIAHDRRRPTHAPSETSPDWHASLHEALGAEGPCNCCDELDDVLERIDSDLAAGGLFPRRATGHDADVTLARAVWIAVHHLRPAVVVETGVARGITSRVIIEGLERNGSGGLWSIDLPPVRAGLHREARVAVPHGLRERWSYRRGASRRLLSSLLAEVGEVDVFVHDSLHTGRNISFELRAVWPCLRRPGVIVADDVSLNDAFTSVASASSAPSFLAAHEEGDGHIGIIVKPVGPAA